MLLPLTFSITAAILGFRLPVACDSIGGVLSFSPILISHHGTTLRGQPTLLSIRWWANSVPGCNWPRPAMSRGLSQGLMRALANSGWSVGLLQARSEVTVARGLLADGRTAGAPLAAAMQIKLTTPPHLRFSAGDTYRPKTQIKK